MLNTLSLFWTRIRYPLGAMVAWVATLVGLVSGSATIILLVWDTGGMRELVQAATLSSITIIAFIALAVQNFRRTYADTFVRNIGELTRAAEIQRKINTLLENLIEQCEEESKPQKKDTDRIMHLFRELLTIYATIYSSITGTRCRFCIKLIRPSDDHTGAVQEFYLYSLARDAASFEEEKQHDRIRDQKSIDALRNNTDFLKLWDPSQPSENYFISDDLSKEHGYKNTSIHYRQNIQSNPNSQNSTKWSLWYRSTIVWPIRQDADALLGIEDTMPHGFLAVDSRVPNTFDRGTHVALGRTFAISLYPLIDLYTRVLE